jgi:hypothetical protein
MMPPEQGKLRYYFDVTCREITSSKLGQVPGGTRVHVTYYRGDVKTAEEDYGRDWLTGRSPPSFQEIASYRQGANEPSDETTRYPEWMGIDAEILNGTDWALVREDAVATFDGRITIRTKDREPFLIDAVLSASVDLRNLVLDNPSEETARTVRELSHLSKTRDLYGLWRAGGVIGRLPATFSIKFEAAGKAEPWAADEYKKASKNYWKYIRLTRGLFIGAGSIRVGEGDSPITEVSFRVYEVTASQPAVTVAPSKRRQPTRLKSKGPTLDSDFPPDYLPVRDAPPSPAVSPSIDSTPITEGQDES